MKVAIITDLHFGVRNDSLGVLDYFRSFYEDVFFPFLDKEGIDRVLILGDLIHRRKYINFIVLSQMKEMFLSKLKERGITTHCIVGNHDSYYRNTNDINGIKLLVGRSNPIGKRKEENIFVGADDPNFHIYTEEPVELELGSCKILMVPWINNGNYDSAIEALENTDASIVMGHFDIKGFEMHKGAISEHGFPMSQFSRFNMVFSGHYHHKSSHGNIHYLGAPYEMTWSDYNDPKGFHIFDTETKELDFIKNPYLLFVRIDYNDEDFDDVDNLGIDYPSLRNSYVKLVVKKKTNPYLFDLTVSKIEDHEPLDLQTIEESSYFTEDDEEEILTEAEDTLSLLYKYIESLEDTDTSKVKSLKTFITDIYTEALDFE